MSKWIQLGEIITPAPLCRCKDGKYPILSMTMHDGIVLQSDRFKKSLASSDTSNYKVVRKSQLVEGFPIDEGVIYVQKIVDEGIMSPAYRVWDIDINKVEPDYLDLVLHCERAIHYYKSKLRGTTVRRRTLPTPTLLAMEILLPTKTEQQLRVMKLKAVQAIIDISKRLKKKLDTLVKSRFIEMFGDLTLPIVHVEDICSDIVDCPHTTPKYQGELLYPAIRTTEIKEGYIDWTTMKYVAKDEYDKRISRLKPLAGDIVYGREGTYGNAAILPEGYDFCLGQRVMLFRTDMKKCLPLYLLQALISDDVKRQADSKNTGSTVAHVNVADAKKFTIPLPPIALQNQFAAFVQQVDKSKSVLQKLLEKQELLRAALMQEYFG